MMKITMSHSCSLYFFILAVTIEYDWLTGWFELWLRWYNHSYHIKRGSNNTSWLIQHIIIFIQSTNIETFTKVVLIETECSWLWWIVLQCTGPCHFLFFTQHVWSANSMQIVTKRESDWIVRWCDRTQWHQTEVIIESLAMAECSLSLGGVP